MDFSPPSPYETNKTLLNAFSPEEFAKLLSEKLDVRMDRISNPSASAQEAFSDVIKQADQAGWLPELVREAYRSKPGHPGLAKIYADFGFATPFEVSGMEQSSPSTHILESAEGVLESIIGPSLAMNPEQRRHEAARIEPKICRVECFGMPSGTGFLIGPDLILTAFCVVERLTRSERAFRSRDLRFRFDYKGEFSVKDDESLCYADENWLVASSQIKCLDYALIRLAPTHDERRGRHSDRGWLYASPETASLSEGDTLMLFQYPRELSSPLTLTIATNGIVSTDKTRLFHSANTGPGSAGAPCFDHSFNLVGMHHAKGEGAGEAILISAIVEHLKGAGHAHLLGSA